MTENDTNHLVLTKLLRFYSQLQNIRFDSVDYWYINEFHKILDELEEKYKKKLDLCRIKENEKENEIDVMKPIFGFAECNFTINKTIPMVRDDYPYTILIDKNKILFKINTLFVIFDQEIKKLNK